MAASARTYGTRQESRPWRQKPNRKARLSIILIEDVPNLGTKGQLVKVKHGYGRNWLLPMKKAVYATPDNIRYYNAWEMKEGEGPSMTESVKNVLSTKSLSMEREPESKWALREQDLSTALRKQLQLHVPLDCIEIDSPIVSIGEHVFHVRLNDSTLVNVALCVSPPVPGKQKEQPTVPT